MGFVELGISELKDILSSYVSVCEDVLNLLFIFPNHFLKSSFFSLLPKLNLFSPCS